MNTVSTTCRGDFAVKHEPRWRIWLLFGLLLLTVFAGFWVAALIVSVVVYLGAPVVDTYSWLFSWRGTGILLIVALAVAAVYWGVAQIGARERLLRAMHCRPLDRGDRYHERLANIVEEMRIAAGGARIECVTVHTVGLNAFAFSDLRGGSVIGVTEGALARLSRQQLQAVVAFELAQVLSETYVTVTVSCLLFGIYSALEDQLDEAVSGEGGAGVLPLLLAAVALRVWVWVLQLVSSITSAALSRQRDREADLAASRYTRDPLSLAEALRIIGRHPGGAGYIPEGLAPLCVRSLETRRPWLLGRWRDTHPPLEERVMRLLGLAHVGSADFARQVDEAADHFERREHWAAAPACRGAGREIGAALAGAPPASAGGVAATPAGGSSPATAAPVAMMCPSCGARLADADYEGVRLVVCPACAGRLVTDVQLAKLLARREMGFTDEQTRLADLLAASGDQLRRAARLARGRTSVPLVACPRCGTTMLRRHVTYSHAVEIDYCCVCDATWFEADELEALQILVERQAG